MTATGAAAPADSWQGRIAECLWLAAAVLIPLAFDVRANQAFELPKLVVLSVLAAFAGTLAALDLVAHRRRPVLGAPFALALVWLAVVFLATFRSANVVESFWGSYDRQSGLILATALVALATGPWKFLRSTEQLRRLAWAVVLGSVPVLLYGLAQRAGLDPVGWIGRPLGVTSTLGASTALGGYLALCAALTLAGILSLDSTNSSGPRVALVAILALQLCVLALTSVRAALAGCVLGLLVTFLMVEAQRGRLGRRGIAMAALAVLLIGTGVLTLSALRGASVQVDRGSLPRADTSVTERLDLWRTTARYLVDAAATRTIDVVLGAGPDQQAGLLELWLEPSLPTRLETTRFDRVHLSIADTVLTTGLVGLLAGAALLVGGARQARQGAVRFGAPGSTLLAGIVGGLSAFVAESSVSFTSVTSLSLVAILLGAIHGFQSPREEWFGEEAPSWNPTFAVLIGLITVALAVVVPSLGLHWIADRTHQRALAFAGNESLQEAILFERRAVLLAPYQDLYAAQLAELLLERAESAPRDNVTRPDVLDREPGVLSLVREAVAVMDKVDGGSPEAREGANPFSLALHARALDELLDAQAVTTPGTRAQAFAFAQRAVRMAPLRVSLKDAAAGIALRNSDPQASLRLLREAAALDPDQPQRIAQIGHAYRALGDSLEAQRWYERALRIDEQTAEAWWGISQLLIDRDNWEDAVGPAIRAARYQMGDWRFRRDLGRIYRELGDVQSARQELRAAARLCPAWEWSDIWAEVEALAPGS